MRIEDVPPFSDDQHRIDFGVIAAGVGVATRQPVAELTDGADEPIPALFVVMRGRQYGVVVLPWDGVPPVAPDTSPEVEEARDR